MDSTIENAKEQLRAIKAKIIKELQMHLILFMLPTRAVLRLITIAKEFRIELLTEKHADDDIVLLQVQKENTLRIYLLEVLCTWLKKAYARSYESRSHEVHPTYEKEIQEVLKMLRNT